MTRTIFGLAGTSLFAVLVLGGCGAASSSSARPSAANDVTSEWTPSQLRKLDPELRDRVRRGERGRVAVKVFFHELPTDSELSELMLNRLGEVAVGQLAHDELHVVAARTDVERIEPLSDVGYEQD